MDDVAIPGTPLQSVAAPGITTVLSIIVPTLNERENIEPLVALLAEALPDTTWEAIFVDDDSRDGTSEHVRTLARRNPRVRCIQRIGRRHHPGFAGDFARNQHSMQAVARPHRPIR